MNKKIISYVLLILILSLTYGCAKKECTAEYIGTISGNDIYLIHSGNKGDYRRYMVSVVPIEDGETTIRVTNKKESSMNDVKLKKKSVEDLEKELLTKILEEKEQ